MKKKMLLSGEGKERWDHGQRYQEGKSGRDKEGGRERGRMNAIQYQGKGSLLVETKRRHPDEKDKGQMDGMRTEYIVLSFQGRKFAH